MSRIAFVFVWVVAVGCGQRGDVRDTKIAVLETHLRMAGQEIEFLQSQLKDSASLRHLVLLSVDFDVPVDSVFDQLARLSEIKEVAKLELGRFADLSDPRAMRFQVILSTQFESESLYRIYESHPIHMDVKSKLKPYLSAPPVVYDYRPR